jgi:hypothetical protein
MFRVILTHPQEALKNSTWYIECVLCQLAATRVGVERSTSRWIIIIIITIIIIIIITAMSFHSVAVVLTQSTYKTNKNKYT